MVCSWPSLVLASSNIPFICRCHWNDPGFRKKITTCLLKGKTQIYLTAFTTLPTWRSVASPTPAAMPSGSPREPTSPGPGASPPAHWTKPEFCTMSLIVCFERTFTTPPAASVAFFISRTCGSWVTPTREKPPRLVKCIALRFAPSSQDAAQGPEPLPIWLFEFQKSPERGITAMLSSAISATCIPSWPTASIEDDVSVSSHIVGDCWLSATPAPPHPSSDGGCVGRIFGDMLIPCPDWFTSGTSPNS
mmetsp:Transcript_89666/g.179166  ORF Transcript_89666/g.179166 Transcript_89666/m.179166 type:complete len:248 (-) Transcript_89666:680-1423(-)